MARIRVVQTITGVRAGFQEEIGADSDFATMFAAMKDIVGEGLPEGDPRERPLRMTFEVGCAGDLQEVTTNEDPEARIGKLVFAFELPVSDEVARGFRDPEGPVFAYVGGVFTSITAAFASLPDSGAALAAAIGMPDEAISNDVDITVRFDAFVDRD